jgi:hypothetical protein
MAKKPVVKDDFLEFCANLEWASSGRPDSRDALLKDVVRRAKELLDNPK